MGKFFTVEVRPTLPAAIQVAAYADTEILFDWTAFNIPKGAAKLLGVTALVRGADGADQAGGFDFELIFAKSTNGGSTAPTTLGTTGAAVDTPGWQNHLIGRHLIDASVHSNDGDLVYMNVMTTSQIVGPINGLVLEGEPMSGINSGYDKLYVAGISKAAYNFTTEVNLDDDVDVSGLSTATITTLDGTACNLVFAPGDIVYAQDGIILGEVESVDANNITFKTDGSTVYHGNGETLFTNPDGFAAWQVQNGAGAAGDLADDDELHNIHPITLIFSFEK